MKFYTFRTVRLSIIRSLFTAHSAIVYVILVCRQLSSKTRMVLLETVYKLVWHTPLLSVQWINSWWWTDELSETCRISWQNKFVKLVHIIGFITKKFVTMDGHINVKYAGILMSFSSNLSSKVLCVDRSHIHSLLYCHPNRHAIGTKVHFAKFLIWGVLLPPVTSSCHFLLSLPPVTSSCHFLLSLPPVTSFCHFLPLRPKHTSRYFVLEHPQSSHFIFIKTRMFTTITVFVQKQTDLNLLINHLLGFTHKTWLFETYW